MNGAPDWVFAYGSLIWDPGFAPAEAVPARLDGFARRFCLRSIQHRGTRERPGLVLGLDVEPGAGCQGVALRLPATGRAAIVDALRARELVTHAYRERVVEVTLGDGRMAQALTYVMRRRHWQYAGVLDPDAQADIIVAATGGRGPNADYLFNTVAHLDALGLPDPALSDLADRVRARLTG